MGSTGSRKWLCTDPRLGSAQKSSCRSQNKALANLGGMPGTCPQGSRFFRFDIQNFQKSSC